jgi:ubiquinone/menaquinone biosynthesis C-methylase UbiE
VWNVGNAFKVHEFLELVEPSGLEKNHTVLDLGCGTGLQTVLLARRCRSILGVDVGESAIKQAIERANRCGVADRATFRCVPIEEAGLPANSFDRVYSFCVLEHIDNLDRVLEELFRVMKPGGEMHVTVDSLATIRDRQLVEKHFQDHFVVEYFTPATISERLTRAGFELEDVHPLFTSDFAAKAFEERIINRGSVSILTKLRLYLTLRSENTKDATKGIMVLARVRKPLASNGR